VVVIVVPTLSDGVIILTGYADDDIPDHLAGEDEETLRRFGLPKSTEDGFREAYRRWSHSWETGGPTRTFAARDATNNQLLGGCELRLQPDGSAHVSYWTSAGKRNRGHATRTLTMLLQYGISIGVTRFESHIAHDNLASRRVTEKAGFRCIGAFTDNDDGQFMIKYQWPSTAVYNANDERREHLSVLRYHIRPATAEDVEFLADVVFEATQAQGRVPSDFDELQWRKYFDKWSLEQVRGEIANSTTSVIEVGNERVGRLRITRTSNYIELNGIQLLPRVQRRGIGTSIVEDLKSQAATAGIPFDLDVEKDNPGARRLYERLGFVQIGETEQECKLRWNP